MIFRHYQLFSSQIQVSMLEILIIRSQMYKKSFSLTLTLLMMYSN